MTHRTKLFACLAALALASLACGVDVNLPDDAITIGETVTTELLVPRVAGDGLADVLINFGAGDLRLRGGGDRDFLAQGTASYNIAELKPEITLDGNRAQIDQGKIDYDLTGLPNLNQIKNELELFLSDTPMELEIRAGAYSGDFDFGGLALSDLTISTGASDTEVDFSSPNHIEMGTLRFNTGASSVYLGRLANANADWIEFKGGAGSYTFDFYGELQHDLIVNIDAALSSLEIRVPAGVPATVNLTSGFAGVNTRGGWHQTGDIYTQEGSGYSITFNINLGAGNLDLEN